MSDQPQEAWENDDAPMPRGANTHGVTTGRWSGAAEGRKSHTVYPKQVIVLVGTLGRGIDFYGPFKDGYAAAKWVEDNLQPGADVRMEPFNNVGDES